MEVIVSGWAMSFRQAAHAASTIGFAEPHKAVARQSMRMSPTATAQTPKGQSISVIDWPLSFLSWQATVLRETIGDRRSEIDCADSIIIIYYL
jgi:hypothetical protein